jgi:uncharacterized protein YprB with RNaseH-like and TPR domain
LNYKTIAPLKRGFSKKNNVIVFDVETTGGEENAIEHDFKLAVIHRIGKEEDYITVYTKQDLTKSLLEMVKKSENVKNLVFAHQSQYDCAYLDFNQIKETYDLVGYSTSPFFISYRGNSLSPKTKKKRSNQKNLLFLDSLNFLKTSLKELGKMFGLPKGKIDFKKCSIKELEIYCKRDVEILEKVVEWIIEFHRIYNVPMSLTFPMFTYRLYRKKYLPVILKQTTNEIIMELERASYHGGRVEVFDFNKWFHAFVYDFNSLYPAVMSNNFYPISLLKYYSIPVSNTFSFDEKLDLIIEAHKNKFGVIAEVSLEIPKSKFGIVPFRFQNKLCFPNGEFTTTLCTPELETVIENITSINQFSIYNMEDIFSEYIYYCYEERKKAIKANDDIMNWFWKLLMNSLYGKFAQRKFSDIRRKEFDNHFEFATSGFHENGKLKNLSWLGGLAIEKKIENLNPNSFVAIASFVTSYARAKLYRYLVNYPDVLYCDTDSLFLPNQEIESSKILGGLKLEKIYDGFQAYGNKWYYWQKEKRFDGKEPSKIRRKIKGVPTKAILKSENKTEMVYEMEHITKFKESIKRFGSPIPLNTIMIKHLSKEYTKRIKLSNGTTKCLQLN